MSNPKFSIIIPVYNSEKYISQTLNSILSQTCQDFELLLADDASADSSLDILNNFAQNDSRINVISSKKNRGSGALRNECINIAKGDYICFVDSDDWVEPNYLQTFLEGFRKYDSDSVWCRFFDYAEDGKLIIKLRSGRFYSLNEGEFEILPEHIAHYPSMPWFKAYKRNLIVENKIKFMENTRLNDRIFYYNYFSHFPKCAIINNTTYNYRELNKSLVHDNQKKLTKIKDVFSMSLQMAAIIEKQNMNPILHSSIIIYAKIYCSEKRNEVISHFIKPLYADFLSKYRKIVSKRINKETLENIIATGLRARL